MLNEPKIWEKYTKAKEYIDNNGIVNKSRKAWDFYLGDQWKGCDTGGEIPPVYNFIKKAVKYKVGMVCQNKQTAHFKTGKSDDKATLELLDAKYASDWTKAKMDNHVLNLSKASAIQRDAYIFWGTGNFYEPQILSNTCILLSDEQNENIQEQKWIIIRERLFVSEVRKKAKANNIPVDEIMQIATDRDNDYIVGNTKELDETGEDGKITSLIYMEKIDGIVWIARAVKGCTYEPLRPLAIRDGFGEYDTHNGMKLYPIANMVWESVPNSARGRGAVEEMIPNQLEVNKTLFRRVISTKLSAFPRLAYAANMVQNPEDIDKVGSAIAVNNGSSQRVTDMVSYLPPQAMSQDAKTLDDDLIQTTSSLSGSDDAITGTTDLARVASSTVLAVRDQQALNLNENIAKLRTIYEDIGRIWFDQLRTYNPGGIELQDEALSGDVLAQLEPEVEITVTQDTSWTRDNEQTWWDNMLTAKWITFEEYGTYLPSGGSVPKDKVSALLKARAEKMQAQAESLKADIANGVYDDQLGGNQNAVQQV